MRNQSPMRATPHWRAESISRFSQTSDSRQRPGVLYFKISLAGAERQPARQIPIGAVGADRDCFHSGEAQIEIQIDKRNVYVSALIIFALRRPPRGVPETARLFALVRMTEGIKRLKLFHGFSVGRDRRDRIDRIDFRAHLLMNVRNDAIFVMLMRQIDRIGGLMKEVDDRRAAELKSVGLHRSSRRIDIPHMNNNIKQLSEPGSRGFAESRHVEEQELVGEREIFTQQPVSGK